MRSLSVTGTHFALPLRAASYCLYESMTPLLSPVVPLVYSMLQMSSIEASLHSFSTWLPWQLLAELYEVGEVQRVRVVGADAHALVEDHYALQCRTEREDAVGLVVLLLFSHEDNLHSAILNHILYLLFGTGGIKRDADDAHTIGSEVGIQILDAVLREYRYAVLGLQTEVQRAFDTCFTLMENWSHDTIFHCSDPKLRNVSARTRAVFLSLFVNKY